MKKIFIIWLLLGSISAKADSLVSVSNNMMNNQTGVMGTLDLGTFNPFDPDLNCSTYSAPNTCTANGRDPVNISLSFGYDISLDTLDGSSIDLVFNVDNGVGGAGGFANVNPPDNIYGLTDGNSGSFDLSFDVPLFGPNSYYDYSLDLVVNITINP